MLLGGLLTAASVALGFALAGVPNVELVTFMVFVAGYLLGPVSGAIVGAMSIALHSVLNPLGAAMPPLLAAQIVGFIVTGSVGGWAGPRLASTGRTAGTLLSAMTGGLLTLLYDALTNVGAFYTITGEHAPTNLVQFVVAGLLFTMMHVVWNTAVFAVATYPVLRVLQQQRESLLERGRG